jgi:hypothetical protein
MSDNNLTEQVSESTLRQKTIGVLIWLAFMAAAFVGLYFLSFWVGD